MEEEILARIDKKLDAVVRLLAAQRIEGITKKTEAILVLGTLGLDPILIAEIVNTTPGTVSVRLAEAKRKSKVESRKTRKEESNG